MSKKLENIAIIGTGYSFREKISIDDQGDNFVIQLRDIDNDFTTIKDFPYRISGSEFKKHLLKKGDVLFISKGQNNYAVLFDKEYKAVASSAFFVIRPDSLKVNSEYLTWYINQSAAQSYLHKGKEGTLITNINKQTLSELAIELPPLDVQEKIARLARLDIIERDLTKQLMFKRKQLLEKLLLSKI